jgi:hypothetical protein
MATRPGQPRALLARQIPRENTGIRGRSEQTTREKMRERGR